MEGSSKFHFMKYFSFCPLILAAVCLQVNSAYAQNLVPNPSFEEYLFCPPGIGYFDANVVGWEPWADSPDFFHVCSNDIEGFAGVPDNVLGNQQPVSGLGYAGMYTYFWNLQNSREYIANQLTMPLSIGQSYYVMFYISHSDGGLLASKRCATNRFGLKFFKDPSYSSLESEWLVPTNNADIEYNTLLTDTSDWTLVEGWFTANDSYNWIALGNFYEDFLTDTMQFGDPGDCFAYYYLDNVCVGLSSDDCSYLLFNHEANKKQFQPKIFPNPAIDWISIDSERVMVKVSIYNALGMSINSSLVDGNSIRLNSTSWAKGMYFIKIVWYDESSSTFKIIKQ